MTDPLHTPDMQLFPVLEPAVEAALRASIKRFGVLQPATVDQNGRVLDGHHRMRIAGELDVLCPVNVVHVANEDEAREIVRTLNMDRRHLDPHQRKEMVNVLAQEGHSERAIAGALGVSPATVHRDIAGPGASREAPELPRDRSGASRDPSPRPRRVAGRDGKSYPSTGRRKGNPDVLAKLREAAQLELPAEPPVEPPVVPEPKEAPVLLEEKPESDGPPPGEGWTSLTEFMWRARQVCVSPPVAMRAGRTLRERERQRRGAQKPGTVTLTDEERGSNYFVGIVFRAYRKQGVVEVQGDWIRLAKNPSARPTRTQQIAFLQLLAEHHPTLDGQWHPKASWETVEQAAEAALGRPLGAHEQVIRRTNRPTSWDDNDILLIDEETLTVRTLAQVRAG